MIDCLIKYPKSIRLLETKMWRKTKKILIAAINAGYNSYVKTGFGSSVKNNLRTPAIVFGFNSLLRSTFFPFICMCDHKKLISDCLC